MSLLLSGNVNANKSYVTAGTYCNILTKKDPTSLISLVFVKKTRIETYDRRGSKYSLTEVFRFDATFEKGYKIKIYVNLEFKTKDNAKIQALKYGIMVGQIPNFLKEGIKTLTIHKGNKNWGGGNNNILIHTDSKYGACEEEAMIHEGGHTSLDWAWNESLDPIKWKTAAKADNKFISKYAKKNPNTEDVAETTVWWIAARCKTDKISKSNYKKILKGIPNRLKYLDEQNFDMYPFVCK